MKKNKNGLHIRLTEANTTKILKLANKFGLSYTAITNQLIEQIDTDKLKENIETKVVTIKKIKL